MKSDQKRDISHWIEVLARLVTDMRAAWRARGAELEPARGAELEPARGAELEPARMSGKDGRVADSRTGVTTNRVKAVWKGQRDEFYEGWRRA